jgi:hypothetical protein
VRIAAPAAGVAEAALAVWSENDIAAQVIKTRMRKPELALSV